MTLIRPFMRVATGLFPHNANRRYLIPNRGPGNAVPVGSPVVTTTTMLVTFSEDIFSEKLANLDGYTVTVNAVGGSITDLSFPTSNQLLLTFTPAGIATQVVVITYDGDVGLLRETASLLPVLDWSQSGAVV